MGMLLSATAMAQVIRPFTKRYYNPSVKGSIIYVSNSIISSNGIGSGVPGTGELPPGGSSTNNSATAINIDVDNTTATLMAYGSTWKYWNADSRPANWQTTAYSDASWPSGAGELGYGDGDEVTCVPSSSSGTLCLPTGNKYMTNYFRQVINIPNPSAYASIIMNVVRDDGIVVYVNGTEVARNNMPTGAPSHSTAASSNINGAAETTPITFTLSPSVFVAGNNTIAVEIHQDNASSSDMSFRMELLGVDNQGTYNSSSADLNLPGCSTVLFAGLYWGAGEGSAAGNTSWITGETTCKLKLPGASTYTTITSTQTDYHNPTLVPGYAHTGYKCFADITSLMNVISPNGTYTVANVLSSAGKSDAYGGWTIVIAYSNSTFTPRNLTIFDGNAIVKSGSGNADVAISGFLTPPSGTVSCELGTVVYDGDRTSSDGFQFKQNGAASFYDMATTAVPLNASADAWNSKISHKGAVVTTRNPAFNNTLGYDASIFDLPNSGNAQLSNNQTSATVRFFSNSENVIVQVLTTSISQYTPAFSFTKSATDLNGGITIPGDSIRYKINYSNIGNDHSTNTMILDNIPVGASYKPNSIKINGVAKTDGSGDDQAEYDLANNRIVFRIGTGANAVTGGVVNTSTSGNVEFDVIAASSCAVLSCVGNIVNKATIKYSGQTSGAALEDTSGVDIAGCVVAPVAVAFTPAGACFYPADTVIINRCPVTSAMIPYARYAGYRIYSAMPFTLANLYNAAIPVTASRVYWAYFNNGSGCSDTIKINMIITPCADIDDDNDGIPDYVEFDDTRATGDDNGNNIQNWNDATYTIVPWIDRNGDAYNDNFDWGADSDNDGVLNFRDTDFWTGWVDVNGDGINDKCDKDLDGIPNQYDLDSDNDGIPDTVESYGVDTNGDGVIDNYVDTDNDGFSQNVDANNSGVTGSKVGLGAQDLDGDGIPNYLDTDSDNDGIPDGLEVQGADTNNDGKVDGFVDMDGDGLADAVDGDVGNDGVAENAANALLRTGPDTSPVDGRADNYPYKNMDNDRRPNPYDLDSDGDGIADVIEGGFADANYDGFVDGSRGPNGWNSNLDAQPTLSLNNTDGRGNPDYMDIDADDDGIPDNIEGQTTAGYKLPANADADNDGIDDSYDATNGFGGSGIFLSDKDGDNLPDYRDLDTDADGKPDIIEGNDFNRNGIADDNVTLTLLDTDGDGLDNRFDSLTSTINIKGTSYNMGTGGTGSGDVSPGGRTPVQKTQAAQLDRDWRYVGYVLEAEVLEFTGKSQINNAVLNWSVISSVNIDRFEIERSTDNMIFEKVNTVSGNFSLNERHGFTLDDNIGLIKSEFIYYRLKIIASNGQVKFSNVIVIRKYINKTMVNIQPNPAANSTTVSFSAEKEGEVTIRVIDAIGKSVMVNTQKVYKGNNAVLLNNLSRFNDGVYTVQLIINGEVVTKKLIIQN